MMRLALLKLPTDLPVNTFSFFVLLLGLLTIYLHETCCISSFGAAAVESVYWLC